MAILVLSHISDYLYERVMGGNVFVGEVFEGSDALIALATPVCYAFSNFSADIYLSAHIILDFNVTI